jgi:hypothetical protein
MSAGKLQEMELTSQAKQSKTAVNANAKPGDPMHSSSDFVSATPGQTIDVLGGPTPYNYKSTDDSAKLAAPKLTHVQNVVNAKASRVEEAEYEYDEDEELVEESEEEEEESGKKTRKKRVKVQEARRAKKKEEEEEEEEEDGEEDEEEDEEEGGKKDRKKIKEEFDEESEDEDDDIDFDVEDDIQALFGDEELSEEFKSRAALVFESALRTKVAEAASIIEARYESALEENVIQIQEQLTERVDSYLEYVSQEWIQENALQVERGLQVQLAESFLSKLRGLFEEHYVSIPEDKYDVLESMVEKLDNMESRLNEQIETNIQLTHRLSESVSDGIIHEVSRGLAETQKEKLASLAESVEFVSEEDYREKLETLRESYFPKNPMSHIREDEMLGTDSEVVSDSMSAYLNALTKFSK